MTTRYSTNFPEVAIPRNISGIIYTYCSILGFFHFAYSVLRKPEVFIVRMLPPPKVLILYLGS